MLFYKLSVTWGGNILTETDMLRLCNNKIFWHMVVLSKPRKLQLVNICLSNSVITENPNEEIHVSSALDAEGKTNLRTPNCMRTCKQEWRETNQIYEKSTNITLSIFCISPEKGSPQPPNHIHVRSYLFFPVSLPKFLFSQTLPWQLSLVLYIFRWPVKHANKFPHFLPFTKWCAYQLVNLHCNY